MSRNCKIDARFTADEAREIERYAKALGKTKSEYLRLCALHSYAQKTSAPVAAPEIESRIDALAGQVADLQSAVIDLRRASAESAAAFDSLLAHLRELLRVPSFREYRARAAAEGDRQRPGESSIDTLLRLARDYHRQYGVWPDIRDTMKFGTLPNDVDPNKWPSRAS